MKGSVAVGLLALAVAVAGCTDRGGVRTVRGDISAYSPTYLQYAASRGALPAFIRGEAFPGMPRQALETRVLDEMKDRPLGVGPLSFNAMPPGAAKPPLFVSLVFNPEPSFDSRAACEPARADRAGGPARPDGSTRVVAAFCSSEKLLSGTVGEAGGLSGAADPRFGQLIRVVMSDLFPPYDPNLGPSIPSCPAC